MILKIRTGKDDSAKPILRAIALPVRCAIDGDGQHQDWNTVAEAIQDAWRNATDLANWGLAQCHLIEARRQEQNGILMGDGPSPELALYTLGITKKTIKSKRRPGGKPGPRLYPDAAKWDVAGLPQSAAAILRAVEKKWRKDRRAALLLRSERIPCFRFPMPFPVNRQSWDCGVMRDGQLWVSVVLPGGRVRLQLRRGPEFVRQVAVFRRIAAGELTSGELAIYRVSASNHRRIGCTEDKPTGGGNTRQYQTMVKIVYRDTPRQKKGGAMVLLRDPDCLWVAQVCERKDFLINEDLHRRLRERMASVAAFARTVKDRHATRVQRLADDYKLEVRSGTPRVRRRQLFERCADKYDHRMRTACQQAVAALVGFAVRQGVSRIFYDPKGLEGTYNWSTLDSMLKNKCKEPAVGIELCERQGPLARRKE